VHLTDKIQQNSSISKRLFPKSSNYLSLLNLIVFIFLLLNFSITLLPAEAATKPFLNGMTLRIWNQDELTQPELLADLERLKTDGINTVVFVIPYYMANPYANDFKPNSLTPKYADLLHVAQAAKTLGMSVVFKPHIDVADESWRGTINPSSKKEWFAQYKNLILYYGKIAEKAHVDIFVIGTELDSMSGMTPFWQELIHKLRAHYHGKLTYAATYTAQAAKIGFWKDLDYIGINAYGSLTKAPVTPQQRSNEAPDIISLSAAWHDFTDTDNYHHDYLGEMAQLSQRFHKKVLFTEIGYRSALYATDNPGDWSANFGSENEETQRNAYQAAYQACKTVSWLAGFFWWDWHPGPEKGNMGYSPKNKEAEKILHLGQ
jgi:hypothetical protein